MGAFGFFLFLSVVVIATTYKSIVETKIRQETLLKILAQGISLNSQQLQVFVGSPPPSISFFKLKVVVLLLLGVGSIGLSIAYWEEGMLPVLIAGLIAITVAYATFRHEQKIKLDDDSTFGSTER